MLFKNWMPVSADQAVEDARMKIGISFDLRFGPL